jgi:hypothetical protein
MAASCSGGKEITLTTHTANANVMINIFGYYTSPLTARVAADGTGTGSQVSDISRDATGAYSITFTASVVECIPHVTTADEISPPDSPAMPQGYATARVLDLLGGVSAVVVDTFDRNGNAADLPFRLEVTC